MQPGIVAAGERILSFISSFHCFFRQKKIFFLKKAAINTYIKNKKIKKLDSAYGFHHPVATHERKVYEWISET